MRCYTRVVRTAALIRDGPAGNVRSATRAFCLRVPHSAYAAPFGLAAPSGRDHRSVIPASALLCVGRRLRAARALPLPRPPIDRVGTYPENLAREAIQQERHMSTHERDSFVRRASSLAMLALALLISPALAQRVVDIPTRPGVTQRMIIISPANPKAAVVLFSGGHGGLQIFPNGSFKSSEGNFLVRTRQLFADQGLLVALVDAPSDRQSPPYLGGFRQKPEHAADIKAVIAWLREQSKVPIWLVGTSRGTVSAAYVATELSVMMGRTV